MVTGLEWTRGAIYWIISAFFLAAITATFAREGLGGSSAVADAYTLVRRRLGAVAAVAVMIWTLFYIGRTASSFAVWQLLNVFHIGLRSFWVITCALTAPILLLAGLLSKFGLVIPELMHNPSSFIRSAIKKIPEGNRGLGSVFHDVSGEVRRHRLRHLLDCRAGLGLDVAALDPESKWVLLGAVERLYLYCRRNGNPAVYRVFSAL